jgi:hypothetical protein
VSAPGQGVQDREVLARLEALADDIREIKPDVKQAVAGVVRLTAIVETQNFAEAISEMKTEYRGLTSNLRTDLIAVNDKIEARLDKIEDTHQTAKGSLTVVGWIANRSPWLVSIAGGLAWAYTWAKGHH